ncbi:ribonuclease domain-containing protein [Lacihabitans soyangensis]|uniref:Ribonuclease n=1 Tax=Lacihabitans soyangensis TaxID=869394 RepID=A0AAE3H1B5_9BACT|nr:ribonuclease domain-containing protein [Lacihabitans soyangensis]MCP9762822.1 ribonuclease [Lacihabitans soyangensis]
MNKLIVAILLFLGGLGTGYFWGKNSQERNLAKTETTENIYIDKAESDRNEDFLESKESVNTKTEESTTEEYSDINKGEVPAKVLKVLKYIEENGEAPEGYVGGRKFKNLEQLLPKIDKNNKRINYREWDVNPKIEGKNRGKERLVTGDDESAYFTNDHYQSFKKIK